MKSMTNFSRAVCVLAVASLSFLSGCGGGGNESGNPEVLRADPGTITVTGSSGSCGAGVAADVHVWGGQPPYKLTNSVPDAVVLSKNKLENSGDGFTVLFLGICLSNMPVTIEDDMGRLISVLLSNAPGK